MYTLGADASRYQVDVSPTIAYSKEIRFVALRATIGNYYIDSEFNKLWAKLKGSGIYVSAYHVLTPEYSAESQLNKFFSAMGDKEPDFPVVLDCELTRGQTQSTITKRISQILLGLEEKYGRKPLIYTRMSWWNPNVEALPVWNSYPLWVARYASQVTFPGDPWYLQLRDWKDWTMWQYTESASGWYYGFSCNTLDLDRFNGDEQTFKNWAESETPAPEPKTKVRVFLPTVNIRSGPSTQYPVIGKVYKDEIYDIHDLGGTDSWVEIAPGKWVAFQTAGLKLLEVVHV